MSFMQECIDYSLDVWQQCQQHPFILGLGDGTLPLSHFKGYMIDDSIYLREYARTFAFAMAKSTTLKEIRAYYSILPFVQNNEDATRIKYLRQWGISDQDIEDSIPRPENKAYADFMLDIAKSEDQPEILMAVLPCILSYYYLAENMIKQNPDIKNTTYWPFINDYYSPGYLASCQTWGAFAEEKCKDLPPERRQKLFEIFRQSSIHELHFWDMSNRPRD